MVNAFAHPEGEWKLAGSANHRIAATKIMRPGGALENCGISAAPSGAVSISARIRWLAPPANFRWPSGPFTISARLNK